MSPGARGWGVRETPSPNGGLLAHTQPRGAAAPRSPAAPHRLPCLPRLPPALGLCSASRSSGGPAVIFPQSLSPPVWTKSQPPDPEHQVPGRVPQGTWEIQQGQSLEPTFRSLAPRPASSGGKKQARAMVRQRTQRSLGQLSSWHRKAGKGPSGAGREPTPCIPSSYTLALGCRTY